MTNRTVTPTTSTKTTNGQANAPTHKLYRVIKGRTDLDKDIWTEVAVCWPHKDGNGFAVKFKSNETPASNADYVMRRDTRRTASANA